MKSPYLASSKQKRWVRSLTILNALLILSLGCSLPGLFQSAPASPTSAPASEVATPVPPTPPPPTPLPPALVEIDPPPGAEIPLTGPITLYFNQAMDHASVEGALSGEPTLSGSFSWENDAVLAFTPDRPFLPETELTMVLGAEARSQNGLALVNPLTLSYETTGYLRLPQVLPEPGAQEVDVTSAIVAAFNRPVVPLGIDIGSEQGNFPAAFSISPEAPGRGEWLNTSTYIFYPEPGLSGGVEYTVTTNPNLTGLDGGPLSTAGDSLTSWTFTTAMPQLVGVAPEPGLASVRIDARVALTFTMPMDDSSVQRAFTLLDPSGRPVEGQLTASEDNQSFLFDPADLLNRASSYNIILLGDVQALGGTPLGEDFQAAFSTVPNLAVVSSNPGPGGQKDFYSPIILYFNADLPEEDLVEYVSISPAVTNLSAWPDYERRTVYVNGDFSPATEYVLTVSANLPDAWGQRLGEPYVLPFQTGQRPPELFLPVASEVLFLTPQDNTVNAQVTNLASVPLNIGQVPLEDFMLMLAPGGYEIRQTYQSANQRFLQQPLSLPENRLTPVEINLTGSPEETLQPGLYYLRFSLQSQNVYAGPYLIVVSNVQITYKISPTDVLVWAVDVQTRLPVANAPVTIYSENGETLVSGATGGDGVFQSDIPYLADPYAITYAVLGEPGDENFSVALSNWGTGVEPWNFGIATDYRPLQVKHYIYTDRPVYRPGQTVYFRVISRQANNGRYTLLDQPTVTIPMLDELSQPLASFDLPLSVFGAAHGSYAIPADAAPGLYRLGDDYNAIWVQVSNYRKPEISLQVAFAEDEVLAGQPLIARVSANYFFGAPAGNLPVRWTLYADSDPFDLLGYRVGPVETEWLDLFRMPDFNPTLGIYVDEGQAETRPDGTVEIQLPSILETLPEGSRARFTLEVTVQDESGLPVSARSEVYVNTSPFYIGIQSDQGVGSAGQESGFTVITVDWDQAPSGGKDLEAEFSKVTWERIDPPPGSPPGMPPKYEPEYTPVAVTRFRTGEDGLARLSYTPPESGVYQLDVHDVGGSSAASGLLLWVGGEGQVVWPDLPNQRLELSADQPAYLPGETATVFIPNPFGRDVPVLVTVERGVVMQHQVITLSGSGADFVMPVTPDFAPNVYLSVTLLGETSAGKPDFRQGYINLPVDPVEQVLNVSIQAASVSGDPSGQLGPGDSAALLVRVTDSNGQPVEGEFSLAVVDKAALALSGPNSVDADDYFYGQQPISVRTALSLAAYSHRLSLIPGGIGGGGGGEGIVGPVVRENFPDTAYWNAEIVTDASGEAQITVTLPDNLTTWVVEVRGVAADTRVGQALIELLTTMDLLVRPVTPRFFVVDDRVRLSAVVHNNTASDLQAEVSLQATGFTLDETTSVTQLAAVPAGGRVNVSWWGRVEDVPSVDLVFSAAAGALEDAVRPAGGAIPVHRYSTTSTFATAGVLREAEERLELISLPVSYDPSGGQLLIELTPSLAAAVLQSLEALEAMPYESNEQIVSRLLANLETYHALESFGIESEELRTRLDRVLGDAQLRLVSRQNEDGSWSWWPGSDSAGDPYVTAYALFGLSRAQELGISVDPASIQQAGDYLNAILVSPTMSAEPWMLDRLAFEHFALAQAGRGDPGGLSALYDVRSQMSPWGRAFLALSFESISPGDERTATLLSDLQAEASRSGAGVHWSEADPAHQNLSTPVFSTAVVVYALARLEPASPLIPDAVRYLMVNRQAGGTWRSSYESAWSQMALDQVMQGTGELEGQFSFSAELNGTPVVTGQAGGEAANLNPAAAIVSMANLYPDYPNALVIERSAGPGSLYYSANLDISRPADSAAPSNRGFSVSRLYSLAGEDCRPPDCTPVHMVAAGSLVTVRLTLVVPEDTYYIMVEDFIPAGAEILDPNLETTQLGQIEAPEIVTLPYDPENPFEAGWGGWYFHAPQIYDNRIAWASDFLPAGAYVLTYTIAVTQPGEYRVLPARAWEIYFPDVQGSSAGEIFEVQE